MIRASDLATLAPRAALAPLPAARGGGLAPRPGWFDVDAAAAGLRIVADGGVRGLSAAQHAERVLAQLRADGDAGR